MHGVNGEPFARVPSNRGALQEFVGLRNDVRRELVLDEGNPVAQRQLSFLQPLDLQAVAPGRVFQRLDGGVEVPMLLHQA